MGNGNKPVVIVFFNGAEWGLGMWEFGFLMNKF